MNGILVIIGKTTKMKAFLLVFTLIFITSFTFLSPQKKTGYQSPDLDKLMVYVPTMAFNYREADTLIIDDALVFTNTYSMKGFYMFPFEVSNGQYLEFIRDLKTKNDSTLKKALPDTLVWREKLAYNEPYVDYYFRHPAYGNYPVVGITQKQCIKYCEWLTEKYNSNEKRKYKKVKFRLPTKYEWYAAAVYRKTEKGKSKDVKAISYYDDNLFPWDGPFLRNNEGKYQANFTGIDESSIHREYDSVKTIYGRNDIRQRYVGEIGMYMSIAGSLNDAADVTAPVDSYWPNDLGIYYLAGNVEEFVAEYGITKGGSWRDPGYYLRNTVIETYQAKNEVTSSRGFRFVMEVIEE
jgi:formylglycine-generating enzyme required for sulfatase activity